MKRYMTGLALMVAMASTAHAFSITDAFHAAKNAVASVKEKATSKTHASQGDCASNMPSGQPVNTLGFKDTTLRCYSEFNVEYDPNTNTPRWSSEVLTPERVSVKLKREDQFQADDTVQSPSTSEYTNTGWDRGHFAAAANMGTKQAMRESFLTTNIAPQHPGNNREIWESLESKVRDVTEQGRTLEVVTGVAFTKKRLIENKKGQEGRIWIPQYFFKVIYEAKTGQYAAYLVPNEPFAKGEYPRFLTSLDKINKASGYKFFPRAKMKSQPTDIDQW